MAEVKLDDITVRYGSKTAIDHFSLHVRDGECLTLLGPSPCGKTTVLRAIAGLAKPDAGEVSIGGTVVASKNRRVFLPPEKRNVGVVFQDYAVWPHMTVEENVSYPLKKRRFPRAEMRNRVDGALEQVRMAQYAKRLPYQLSGGQQQRVALARALVATQDVVLLDEPLCNLDANLREEMRFEIKQLQRDTGITIIYVTHNQDIALVISDRIAVMDRAGAIRQLGEPESLFKNPVDSFVYRFLGVSNFIPVELAEGQMYVRDETETIPFPYPIPANLDTNKFYAACRPMNVALARPSDASIPAPASGEDRGLRGVVKRVIFLGNIYEYRVQLGRHEIRVQQDFFASLQEGVFKEGEVCGVSIKDIRYYEAVEEVSS